MDVHRNDYNSSVKNGAMTEFLGKLLKNRGKTTDASLRDATRPGDGVGYPVPYTGERIQVDHEFLKRCKILAAYSGVYRLNETTVMKTGEATGMSEAKAMRIVAEKTSIPVPKVFDAYTQDTDGRGVILMEFVGGETLDKAWLRYDADQKRHVISQLKGYLHELRAIKGSQIGAVDASSCRDQFFTDENTDYGPYNTERSFHEGLATALRERGDNSWCAMVSRFLTSLTGHEIILTHNDLAPRNILLRDGNIVAILDWELCGFYPDYWEYVKTYLWADWSSAWICEGLPDQVLEPKIQELAYLLHARDIMWR